MNTNVVWIKLWSEFNEIAKTIKYWSCEVFNIIKWSGWCSYSPDIQELQFWWKDNWRPEAYTTPHDDDTPLVLN